MGSSIFRIKDSLRVAVLKEELNNVINPKAKELEKYKKELQRINQEDYAATHPPTTFLKELR